MKISSFKACSSFKVCHRVVVLGVMVFVLAACSSLGTAIVESGLTPTSDIRSSQTNTPGGFIPVGITPPLPGADLTVEERKRVESELLAARTQVQTLLSAPTDKPLP